MTDHQRRIIIIGAGFAGFWTAIGARALIHSHRNKNPAAANIDVVVIAPEPRLVMRPALYEDDPATKATDLSERFHVAGVRFIKGTVDTIDTADHEVDFVDSDGARSSLAYDKLVLAAGSHLVRPGIPGLREHAFDVDQIESAADLDTHLHDLRSLPATESRDTVVVCGAGFTGIELATALPKRLRSLLGQDSKPRVILIDREDNVGASLGPGPKEPILRALVQHGVDARPSTSVTSIDADGVSTASGSRIDAKTVVWTAGMSATPLTGQIKADRDSLGRLRVDEHLRVLGCEDVLATGDAAHAGVDGAGNVAAMSCQHALVMGRVSGFNVAAELLGGGVVAPVPYSQPLYVTCLDLGPRTAVVTVGWDRRVVMTGLLAKLVKAYINKVMIYPPAADRDRLFAAARPPSTLVMVFQDAAFSVLAAARSFFWSHLPSWG